MKEAEKICGTCRWHQKDNTDPGEAWICVNDKSDHCADWTDYRDVCEEWEVRNDKG